ncbi:MAG: DUF92 domain-containing protein [Gemmatimonadales bacterium]
MRRHERAGNLPCVRTWLTRGGAMSAAVVGALVWAGAGARGVALLLAFFVTSSALTKGGGRRRAAQVVANGGIAAACALLSRWDGALLPAFAGALAAAAADTWSTEIGARSARPPRLLTTWQTVPSGTDGGVTLLGSAGGILGAATIGLAARALLPIGTHAAVWIGLGGAAGAFVDSLLGATLQRRSWLNNDVVNLLATAAGALVAAWLA